MKTMKTYNHITALKNTDGTYNVDVTVTRWELLKAVFTGKLQMELSANAASALSAKLYTPKKKYYKKSEKAILKGE
jgi:hypothetical protein